MPQRGNRGEHSRSGRSAGAGLVLFAASLIGGCGGPTTGELPAADIAATGAAPAASTAAPAGSVPVNIAASPPPKQVFNPFAAEGGALPSREVIANPALAEVLASGPLGERSYGRADAPVVLVKYASLTCPHCRRFQAEVFPVLKREYIDTGKVRFILREFPIGHTSGTATITWRCAAPDKHLALYEKYLAQQASWVSQEVRLDPIFAVARQVGMTRAEFDACLQKRELIDGLKWVKERGRTLGVIGTPNFFVNERLVKTTIGVKELRDLLDPLVVRRAGGVATAAPGR